MVSGIFAVSLLFVLGGWLWAYLTLRKIAEPLILHFNSISGITQIGNLRDIANIAVLGLITIFVDFWLAIELEERDRFLGKLLAAGGLFLSILIFIGFAAIIGVN